MIAALVLAAVLFALLWPEERATSRGRARAVLFALLAGFVGFALTSRQADRAASVSTGRAFEAYTDGLVNARAAEAAQWLVRWGEMIGAPPPGDRRSPFAPRRPVLSPAEQVARARERALRSFARAIRLAPDSTLFRRQYAILLADAGRREEALRQFREVARIQAARHQPSDEGALWERLYGPQPPRRAELPALAARLHALRLGWFEPLALREVYRRVGLKHQAEDASDAVARQAAALNLALTAVLISLFGAAFLGLILLFVLLVGWRRGRLRPEPAAMHPYAARLLEAFVLYMFLTASPSLLGGVSRLPRRLPPDRAAWMTLALLLGMDLLSLLPIGYLRSRLRAVGLSLAEIGLQTRALGREILAGFAGYLAVLPLVLGSGFLAHWVGQRFFPHVAPPFHPINALTLTAPSGWFRFGLFLVAAVGAPFLEETFFRGMLYGALRRRFGVAAGLFVSAAIFAGLHPQLPLGFLPIFVLGVALAGLYEWRQSLVPGMVLHALNNTVACIVLNLVFPPG